MPEKKWIIEKIMLIDKLLKADEERDPPKGWEQRDERRRAEDLIYEILSEDPSNRMVLDRLQEICFRKLREAVEPDDDRPWSPYYDVLVKTAMMIMEKYPDSFIMESEILYGRFFSFYDPYLYLIEAQKNNKLESWEIGRLKKTLKLSYWQDKTKDSVYREQYEIEIEDGSTTRGEQYENEIENNGNADKQIEGGSPEETPAPESKGCIFEKTGSSWNIKFKNHKLFSVPDEKGIQYIAYLFDHPGIKYNPLDLYYKIIDIHEPEKMPKPQNGIMDIVYEDELTIRESERPIKQMEFKDFIDAIEEKEQLKKAIKNAAKDRDEELIEKINRELIVVTKYLDESTYQGQIKDFPDSSEKARKTVGNCITATLKKIEDKECWRHFFNAIKRKGGFSYKPDTPIS